MHHIAYCFDGKYQQHFGASLTSLLLNYRQDGSQLHIHIVTERQDDGLDEKISILSATFKANFHVHVLNAQRLQEVRGLPKARMLQFSPAVYYRLTLPQVLPESIRKILYLDSDTIVLESVKALLDIDLTGCAVAGIADLKAEENSQRLATQQYVNSGVLLLNLDMWRKNSITQRCIAWLHAHPEKARLGDQCAINVINDGAIRLLDRSWNEYVLPRGRGKDAPSAPGILHFITADKPWHAWYANPLGDCYWDYLGVSPWKGAQPLPPSTVIQAHKLARVLARRGQAGEAAQLYEKIIATLARRPAAATR